METMEFDGITLTVFCSFSLMKCSTRCKEFLVVETYFHCYSEISVHINVMMSCMALVHFDYTYGFVLLSRIVIFEMMTKWIRHF